MALPDCMMPDGADPCIGYQELARKNDRLREDLDQANAAREAAEQRALAAEGEIEHAREIIRVRQAEVDTWMQEAIDAGDRALAAEARIAAVRAELEFGDQLDLYSYTPDEVENMAEANSLAWELVKDTPAPLAVVDGSIDTQMQINDVRDLGNAFADPGCRVSGYRDAIIVVLPKEAR